MKKISFPFVRITVLFLCCLAAAYPGAQLKPLMLAGGTVDTGTTRQRLAANTKPQTPWIVQLETQPSPEQRQQLLATGCKILDYLPLDAFVLAGPPPALEQAVALPFIHWSGPWRAQDRIDPDLLAQTRQRDAQTQVRCEAGLWPGGDRSAFQATLRGLGASELVEVQGSQQAPRVLFDLPAGQLETLARDQQVQWIQRAPAVTRRNDENRWLMQSGVMNQTPVWDHELHGEGQLIGHLDGEVDLDSCFFHDSVEPGSEHRKIQAYFVTPGAETHGTHTAGIALGLNEDESLDSAGLAYRARLVHGSDLEVDGYGDAVSTLRSVLERAQGEGAYIHTNSWGDDTQDSYTFWCRDIDEFTWDNEDALVIFSTTNMTQLHSPENAKNCLSVAAGGDPPDQDFMFSGGKGPTYDGRRKPDIVARGEAVQSAHAGIACSTIGMSGTSMAAPAIAGLAALTRQYYQEGFYPSGLATPASGFTPSGSLLKATLLASTVDMPQVAGFPNDNEGWGRAVLDNALYFEGDQRDLRCYDQRASLGYGLEAGDTHTYLLQVESTSQPLTAVLVWADPPAAHAATQAWISNLNLEATAPDGTVYLGNVFGGGQSAAGGSADVRNNVEQIRRTEPQTGEWRIRVTAATTPVSAQGYALVITADLGPDPSCARHWPVY